MTSFDHSAALRDASLRVTAPRLAVLEAIEELPHADADAVAQAVRDKLGAVSRQAVYDILNAVTDAEIVRRVAVGGRSMRYEIHRHDNHHHLVCTQCGRLEDIACVIGEAPCLAPSDDHGFEIEIAEIVFRGVCSDCREAAAAASA
ncbi:Fur family transcriptional regulator [Brachybacterium sp. DNPG3]